MEAPAAMTWLIIGLILAVVVVVIMYIASGKLSTGILEGAQRSLCSLPFLKC